MAKRILTLCLALVIGIAFALPAAAAVKSIKVGGDLTIRGIYRDNLDFDQGKNPDNAESWLMSTTRIWVGAELTDNVSVVIRLLNERDWQSYNDSVQSDDSIGYAGNDRSIELDLAYVKLKDLLVPGFSATLGRQEILLGKGFVVGNVNADWFPYGNIRAFDLSARKSFDAWRLDYEFGTAPVTVTLFDAKLIETAPGNEDRDLWGLNVGYKTDNLKVEGYVLLLDQQTGSDLNLFTYGARVDHNVLAVPGLNYNLEGAMQSGKVAWWTGDKNGWAGNGDISYTFQSPMQPKIGAAWYYASGDKDVEGAWVSLAPTNVSDRIGRITLWNMMSDENISAPKIYGSFKPSEKHTLSLAWFPATTIVATSDSHDDIDSEIDLGYTYQYTEDVSFGLIVDYATAGKYIADPGDDKNAFEAIGTVAVSF